MKQEIRPIDIAEYLRGQKDRAEGYPIIAWGDDRIDQDGQAADAYCAGYDPKAELVAYKPGQQAEGEAFRNQLQQAAKNAAQIDTLRISIQVEDKIHLNHHVLREHLAEKIKSLLEIHPRLKSLRVTLETDEDKQTSLDT